MDEKSNVPVQPEQPQRRRFQFSLATMFVVVTAVALLFSQYPFLEFVDTAPKVIYESPDGTLVTYQYSQTLQFNPGFLTVVGIELAAVVAWIAWRYLGPRNAA